MERHCRTQEDAAATKREAKSKREREGVKEESHLAKIRRSILVRIK